LSSSTTSTTNLPTAGQLAASRLRQWHQQGEALLTFENLRSWINATGLVLFSSRSKQLPAPAPTLVEAVLGTPNENPIAADTEQAKILLARMISEGIAVPLNLLGTPGETPDFIASAPVFSYIFTLRGDKAWKQAPSTSGPVKVSPLALATYTLLTERVTMSAYDLTTQLGKEVTESAVLRALNELWVNLRVLPIPQPDGAATLWELTTARFTKLMKAGANAGQPSALSALISLYLNTAIVASEEEIETFLSPLAARSRIRDVVHALMSARQLETIAIEGKTVLHVAGELPGFLTPEGSVVIDTDAAEGIAEAASEGSEAAEGAPRISKFVAKPRKIGTGFTAKPRPGFGSARPGYGAERKPFARDGKPAFDRSSKPSFSKPWQDDQSARPAPSADGVEGSESTGQESTQTYPSKPRFERGGDRPAFTKRPAFGSKPSFGGRPSFGSRDRDDRGGDRPARTGYAGKPSFSRDSTDSRPPRREFTPRPGGDSSEGAPRRTFSKPGTFGRKREGGFAGKPSFGGGDSRPPRRDFGGGDSRPPRREFTTRSNSEGSSDARPPRRDFAPRPSFGGGSGGSDRPSFGGPRKPGSFSPRPSGGGFGGERKPFTPREGGPSRFGGAKPSFGAGGGSSDRRARTDGPPFRKFDAPRGDRPARPSFGGDSPSRPSFGGDRPARSGGFAGKSSGGFAGKSNDDRYGSKPSGGYAGKSSGGYAGKSGGGFGGKKPFSKAGDGKPAGTFDKFKNNAKPFGNRSPARKYRPEEGESKG
jgi:23S rRNA pseudouridine2605 synthase